jgi:hypothetical protein
MAALWLETQTHIFVFSLTGLGLEESSTKDSFNVLQAPRFTLSLISSREFLGQRLLEFP